VLAAPFDERPGLERYAAPAPEDFGTYQTFCGPDHPAAVGQGITDYSYD
jgi:hypothetical protein